MLESTNPEIDVKDLMARIHAEVQRRKEKGAAPPPSSASGNAASLTASLARLQQGVAEVVEAVNQAHQKNKVNPRIPKPAHRLFRDQDAVNRELLRAADLLQQQIETLGVITSALDRQLNLNAADVQTGLDLARQAQEASIARLQAEAADYRAELALQRQIVARLLDKLEAPEERLSPKALSVEASESRQHNLDAFYVAFENRFRGSRAEIREKVRGYLPYLAQAGAGTPEKPVLDLACGRGEWLELLKENKLTARGVDLNTTMVALGRELGLDVIQADAVAHLRSLPARSQGAVTGFHLVEHLPFPVLLELAIEARRVLQPGGIAVFETPNPGNVLVGTNNFYMDPSHLHPLPCGLMHFLLENVGFMEVRIVGLHPYDASSHDGDTDSVLAQRFNEFFYGAQDYAVIGIRPPDAGASVDRPGASIE
jgi:SAM-dependent methyltransferase